MSISATQGANVGALANVDAITRARAGAASAKAPGSARDRTSVSGPGAMLSKLKELQDKDPAKFTAAMSDIATKLDDAAKASTDPKEQKALSELSAKFKTAGETGDLSALGPPKHGKGGPPAGGPPAGGPPAGGRSSSSTSTDPADANVDGTVSDAERKAYDAKQASSGAKTYQQAASSEGRAKMAETMSKVSSIVESVLGATTTATA